MVNLASIDRNSGIIGHLGRIVAQIKLMRVGVGAVQHSDRVLLVVAVLGA